MCAAASLASADAATTLASEAAAAYKEVLAGNSRGNENNEILVQGQGA